MIAVSVVIPHYNQPRWLQEAIESVLSQTFQDFEIIVVDDGSTDPPHLEGILDKRIRFVREVHKGVSAARNLGLRLANGQYVALLDADDLYLPKKLARQVEVLARNPEIALVHTSYVRMGVTGTDLEEVRSGAFGGSTYPGIVVECPIATPTVMLRREALAEANLQFDESVQVGEDTILWIDIARRFRIAGIDEVLAKVRMHGDNAFSSPDRLYRGGQAVLRYAFDHDRGLGFRMRQQMKARLAKAVGHLYLANGQLPLARRRFAEAFVSWPFDGQNALALARSVLPAAFRARLRTFWNGLRR